MISAPEVITPADELLVRFEITDGLVFAIDLRPDEIVIDCAFDTFVSTNNWTRQPARIRLKDPAGCDLAFQYPKDYGLIYAGEHGSFSEIRASGPLDAAEFFLSFSYGAIRVSRCILSIEPLDWDAMENLHPWILQDRTPPGEHNE
ncbi:hypothetical protein P1X14_03910 [Sphingomonas sp. AOB5]|uniref:hypothetical protein n=1 Tax=Sphingomonas sp. AOB5 TaxID=3034017 RepID=UPI0023F923E1|nr:hypothetical protein [Sphingomonas sp. AOB5]MDF7774381.1 hypothetical protein [Sphingomonas sp. AOB5]